MELEACSQIESAAQRERMSSLYGFSISSGKNGRAGTLRGFQIITGDLETLTFL